MGEVWGVYNAVRAQAAARSLLQAARDGEPLYFWGYTLDREDIVDDLIDSCVKRKVTVRIMLDKKQTCSGQTTQMFAQVARLSSNGCQVRLAKGGPLVKEYESVGRRINKEFEGVSHAKAILTGNWFLCGSTNWTTASRGNVERNVLTKLNEHATRRLYREAEDEWDKAEEFTRDVRRFEEDQREVRAEAARSRSEPVSRSGFVLD
jgi:hypothetical protein